MYDIFIVSKELNKLGENLRARLPQVKLVETVEEAQQKSTTKMCYIVWPDIKVEEYFNFDYKPHRDYEELPHLFLNKNSYDGVVLLPKKLDVSKSNLRDMPLYNTIRVGMIASKPLLYDIFEIDTYEDYLEALAEAKTEMFWMTSANINTDNFEFDLYFDYNNEYDRNTNHAFIHRIEEDGSMDKYNGVFLLSKENKVSKSEIENRELKNFKKWDLVASKPVEYDIFMCEDYNDYQQALELSKTELFWIIPNTVDLLEDFEFDWYFPHEYVYDRTINHLMLNGEDYDGVILASKYAEFTEQEWITKEFEHSKEWNIQASIPKPYDIVFISYNEPNADENWKTLKHFFPRAKRVHGVKGIHQAHIMAAQKCKTEMFWIVDGDAQIVEDFDFSYIVPKHQRDHIHVWRSQNPINDLIYGYGGIKLFPRQATINMDLSKPDMTTSISDKFKPVMELANVTAFNTGSFETWKSAFRECCKLSSKVIDRQKDDETNERLNIWLTVGEDRPFGEYALSGARAGHDYGIENQGNIEALRKINDFGWLEEEFKKAYGTE
jgi:hypothetical protein